MTQPLPSVSEFTEATASEAQFKTAQGRLLNYLATLLARSGLAVDARAALGLGGTPVNYVNRGAWVTATAYVVNDLVIESGVVYVCQVAHTSGTFATDAAAGKWTIHQGLTAAVLAAISGAGLVGWQQIGDDAVPRVVDTKLNELLSPKDYDGVVDGATDDTAAVTALKTAAADALWPALVPKRALHTADLVGIERIKTVYSEPWEADYSGQHAATMFYDTETTAKCMGDSTQFGADPEDLDLQVDNPPPEWLQAILRGYFGNEAPVVENSAINGSRTATMLDGTDGSGQTFEERIAATSAGVIMFNPCINDCQGGEPIPTYKVNLHRMVEICRKYGKSPVLCAPNPIIASGGLGVQWKSELLKQYVTTMRQVAAEAAVPLVDNYQWAQKAMQSGMLTAPEVVGDGVHPTAGMYKQIGQNFAIPLIKPSGWLSLGSPYLYAGDDCCLVTGVTEGSAAPTSISGLAKISPDSGAQSIRVPVVIEESGLELYLAHPVWANGCPVVSIKWDLVELYDDFSMDADDYVGDGLFLQDYETRIVGADKMLPGLHLLEITISGDDAGSIGIYYLRVRPALTRSVIYKHTPTVTYRELWLQDFDFTAGAAGDVALLPQFPTSHLDRTLIIEFTAELGATTGVVLCGGMAGNNIATKAAEANIIVGLDSSGFVTVWEGGGAVYDALDNVDLRGDPHTYRVEISTGHYGTVSVYVDGSLVDTHALTRPYWGGYLGFWANQAGATRIDKLYHIASE